MSETERGKEGQEGKEVELLSFTSQSVLMVPLDKVAIILQLAGSSFKSSTECIKVISRSLNFCET